MYFEGNNRIYIAGDAWMLGETRDGIEVASSEWASTHMIPNEANSYILGRFVEADRANGNKQYFMLGDLLMAQPTINYAPLNINHQGPPVGAFISSEMQYPKEQGENPYIEALSAFWKAYFPDTYDKVKAAFAEGALFYSMEAVPETLSTLGGADDAIQYAYEGRTSPTYPAEINDRSCEGIVLNNPHFVGGALIIPPVSPGWNRADVKQLSKYMSDQWEAAEAIYQGVQEMAPQLGPKEWEAMMGALILGAMEHAAVLDTKQRKSLDKSQFAIPEKAPGSGSYPIPDLAHARDALSRSSGKPEEGRVKAAVYKKFPQLKK